MDDLDECRECGAMVDRMSKHRTWHTELDRRLKKISDEAEMVWDLDARVSDLEA